jgi:hypothetical protein
MRPAVEAGHIRGRGEEAARLYHVRKAPPTGGYCRVPICVIMTAGGQTGRRGLDMSNPTETTGRGEERNAGRWLVLRFLRLGVPVWV